MRFLKNLHCIKKRTSTQIEKERVKIEVDILLADFKLEQLRHKKQWQTLIEELKINIRKKDLRKKKNLK